MAAYAGSLSISPAYDVATHSEDDEHNHQSTLWNSRDLVVLVPRQEEQRTQANLLDIHADKDMGYGFREEYPTGITLRGLVVNPDEEIFVHQGGEDEECGSEAIDHRADNAIGNH